MKKIHLMTAMTMVVAVLAQMRALRPAGPALRQQLHSGAGKLSGCLLRMVNDWVAAAIAYRERRVTQFALRNPSDIELKDFGAYRRKSGSALHRYRDVKFATRR